MSRVADKFDISAVADLLAVSIASALTSGGSYTYEDARRTNAHQGWTYELRRGRGRDVERIEPLHLSEQQLSLAWLTANRRVDNEAASSGGPMFADRLRSPGADSRAAGWRFQRAREIADRE